jgi:hypothetical protein
MRNQNRILFMFALLTTGISGQQVPVPAIQAASTTPVANREKAKEDQVAKSFQTIRTDANLPPLSRISHRDSLEQLVCTVAKTGIVPKNSVRDTFTLYKTLRPELISTELKQVASFDDDRYPRYSVAVWQARDRQTAEVTYWVGVERYWSAAFEFFDYHFTDDVFYHNDWKKNIAPECRGK